MNVYDQAHQLATAISESEECKQYKALKEQVEACPEIDKMIKDIQSKSMEIQLKQMSGEQPSQEDYQNIQKLYSIIAMDPFANNYMQAEMRFSLMMKDVYEILGEATGLGGMIK